MALGKADILAMEDREIIEVTVPQWKGQTVHIRTLTGAEAENLYRAARSQPGVPGQPLADDNAFVVQLVARCMCDEEGTLLFGSKADIEALSKRSFAALSVLFNAACKLNGIGEEAEADLGKVSEMTTESASGSD